MTIDKLILLLVITICFLQNVQAQKGGTIAYVRDGVEVRLIDPDGTNDRRLWTHTGEKTTRHRKADAVFQHRVPVTLRSALASGCFGFSIFDQTLMRDSANIFRYDFTTRKVSQVTNLQNEFTGAFTISPDGQWIVFERSKSLDDNREIDLWIARTSGGSPRLLVRNGFSPSWR